MVADQLLLGRASESSNGNHLESVNLKYNLLIYCGKLLKVGILEALVASESRSCTMLGIACIEHSKLYHCPDFREP